MAPQRTPTCNHAVHGRNASPWPAHQIGTLALAIWKDDYNTVRPHSALSNLPPAVFAKLSVPGMQRDGALRYVEGFAPPPRCTTEPTRLK
jgi:hypothetical protein